MKRTYFGVMVVCLATSLAGLVAAAALSAGPWWSIVAGLAPLIFYHLGYLGRRTSDLTSSAIDTVYYFGFLVTVAALSITAVSIGMNGANVDVDKVVYQFGVGLVATAYAVLARVHLSSRAASDHGDAEVVQQRYLQKSLELVDTVESAIVRTREFADVVQAKTVSAGESIQQTMLELGRTFDSAMHASLTASRDAAADVRRLLSDSSLVAEREALTKATIESVEVTAKLNAALNSLAAAAKVATERTQNSADATTSLDASLRILEQMLRDFGAPTGALSQSLEGMKIVSEGMTASAGALSQSARTMVGAGKSVEDVGLTFKTMRAAAKKTHEQVESLAQLSGRLSSAVDDMSRVASSTEAFATQLEYAARILPTVSSSASGAATALQDITGSSSSAIASVASASGSIAQIGPSFSALNGSIEAAVAGVEQVHGAFAESVRGIQSSIEISAKALEADVKRSSQATALLTERLIQVAQTIIDRTRQA